MVLFQIIQASNSISMMSDRNNVGKRKIERCLIVVAN